MSLSQALCEQGYVVVPLIRGGAQSFEGFDVVIHLSGEPLIGRWTLRKRQEILRSRVEGTQRLVNVLTQFPPKLFISASAVGFYGDRGDEQLTEESEAASTFLSDVCYQWEEAAKPLIARGVRVVHTRFGIVLGPRGGILSKLSLPYQLGLGGRLGSGRQWVCWISLRDLVRAMIHIVEQPALSGPINFAAPHPLRQIDFARTLAKALHRPAWCAQPAWLLRILFGQMADELLLASQRVFPIKLLQSGFEFFEIDCSAAIRYALDLE